MNISEILKQIDLEEEKNMIYELYKQLEAGNLHITVRELAALTYCSTSKIIRLAKKMGYYGYSDMLFSFRKQMQKSVELQLRDSLSTVIISEASLQVIDRFIQEIIENPDIRIYLQGLGYSNFVCNYLRDRLVEMGYYAANSNPLDTVRSVPNCIFVVVSNSGETEDLFRIVKGAEKLGYHIYAITSQPASRLCRMVQNNIILTQENFMNKQQTANYFTGNAIVLSEKIVEMIQNEDQFGGGLC